MGEKGEISWCLVVMKNVDISSRWRKQVLGNKVGFRPDLMTHRYSKILGCVLGCWNY